jgi:DeoR/GlpR family transcriptional regulator of sugar metabolism
MRAFASMNADMVFLGTDGFLSRNGPCTAAYDEAEIKKAMIGGAKIKVVLSDSSKFGNRGLFQFCDWAEVDSLVTDAGAPGEELEKIRKVVNVVVA